MASTGDYNKHTGLVGLPPHPSLAPVAAFNESAIENLIKTKGVLAFHVRHAFDYNRETEQAGIDVTREGIERPFLYYDIRPIRLVAQNLSFSESLTMASLAATGDVVFNLMGTYLDVAQRAFLRPNDLIMLNPTVTDMHQEMTEYRGTVPWRFQYRVVRMDYLACRSAGRLEQDVDFTIDENGELRFVSGMKQPKIGEVVSAVYEYRPTYVVRTVPHVIRLLPSNTTGGSSPRVAEFAPQLVLATRSNVREDTTDWNRTLEELDWRQWLDATGP
jgi:hypothetical protein